MLTLGAAIQVCLGSSRWAGCAVVYEALEVVRDEQLSDNASPAGRHLPPPDAGELVEKTELILKVRGKGLLNGIVINDIAPERNRLEYMPN